MSEKESIQESRQLAACSIQWKTKKIIAATYYLPYTNKAGFSLVELMITMVVFLLAIAAASNVFTGLLTQFKQQSKIAETNIEGMVGLEILRRDLESAGYGVPWNVEIDGDGDGNDWEQIVGYCEAVSNATITPNPITFNNGSSDAVCPAAITGGSAPMAVRTGDNTGLNGADYLSIKSTTVALNNTVRRWTWLRSDGTKDDDLSGESFVANDRIIVISPGSTASNSRSLIINAGAFSNTYNNTGGYVPTEASEIHLVYGIDDSTNLRMPFNRTDYYIRVPAALPAQCAPNTGVLYKGTVNHANGAITELPILDCVADMQVVFYLDTDGDGTNETVLNSLAGYTAKNIRDWVKEIRVYILAHEGQRDASYTYPSATIHVGPAGFGRDFNLGANLNYRWKVYTLVVRPNNLV